MNLRKTIFFLFLISLIKTGFSEELISKELTNKKSQQVELEDLLTETNLDEETKKHY